MDFEKLGAFYLGRTYDPATRSTKPDLLLYDSKHLTTHAVCVGMTGSGKTGLCLSLLEEAAIDGIPAIAIDPKGDLGNLLLSFPGLTPEEFRPWIDEAEAARRGLSADEHARATAEAWRKGLAEWGQDGTRIARFREAADAAIYTPGSSAGLPLAVLRSLAAPAGSALDDTEALRERVVSAVSGLLALVGIEADPIQSREHILLATLFERAWSAGQSLDLETLVRETQSPPFERVGVLDLESFYPAKDRATLALRLNGLLASPTFAAWREGEPLDVQRLLFTPEGKPRLSILSIAHLSEPERMFVVTLVLSEVVAWMRAQSGTSSLRAILYMDEVFGYFPPTANPPSKKPMLTLLKQARAYGLGVVLATQNPVDLDYKGLANAGTWFLGRLQTERDKARVIEGLEGVAATGGGRFDRANMEATLAGLENRVFVMNDVHEGEPVVFHTRWALSYLRGPLTRAEIRVLTASRKRKTEATPLPAARTEERASPVSSAERVDRSERSSRPVLPPDVLELFWPASAAPALYHPALFASARIRYLSAPASIDVWEETSLLATLSGEAAGDPWDAAEELASEAPPLEKEPAPGSTFGALAPAATRPKSYAGWQKALVEHVVRNRPLRLWQCPSLRELSKAGESAGDFRARLGHRVREERDRAVAKLEKKYATELARLRDRLARAEERVAREKAEYRDQKLQTAVSIGATVFGALFGRKAASAGNLGRATTAARGIGRAARQREDVARAGEGAEAVTAKIASLEDELEVEVERIRSESDVGALEISENRIAARKSDVSVTRLALVWVPTTAPAR